MDLFRERKTIKGKRNQIATFLQEIVDFVEEKDKDGAFDFFSYVSEWSKDHKCGIVCCMEGWLPALYPRKCKWNYKYGTVNTEDNRVFYPGRVGIPVSANLWQKLTMASRDLPDSAKFPEVKTYWKEVIEDIKSGRLDEDILQ